MACCGCEWNDRVHVVKRDDVRQPHVLNNSATLFLLTGFRHPPFDGSQSSSSSIQLQGGASSSPFVGSQSPMQSGSSSSSPGSTLIDELAASSSSSSSSGIICAPVSYQDCLLSLFVLSNESVNVWSHLLAAFAFACYFPMHFSSYPLDLATSSSSSAVLASVNALGMIPWVLFFIGCTFTFATSAGYHLFLFHSPEAFTFWVRLDLLGVTAGICSSSFLGLSIAFQCFPLLQRFYLGSIICLMAYATVVQMSPHFATERYNTRRMFLFGFLMAFGVMPTIHWSLIAPEVETSLFLGRVITFYCIVACAAFFYASKYPERAFPKTFDYFFSSHQLWHILIVASMVWWYYFCADYSAHRISTPCHR